MSDTEMTELLTAAMDEQWDRVEELLQQDDAEQQLQTPDEEGYTVLHAACQSGRLELVKKVVAAGADVNAVDDDGWTALHYAMKTGTLEVPEFLVKEHGLNVNAVDEDGWSVLHTACTNGHETLAEMLIELGAEVNVVNPEGKTVLHAACASGNIKLVKLLVSRGLDLHVTDDSEWTALHFVMESDNVEMTEYLITEHHLDVNAIDANGWSVLHVACNHGKEALVNFLFDHGVDVNAVASDGATVLHAAYQGESLEVAKLLLKRGLDVNARDNSGVSVLHRACLEGNLEMVNAILGSQADAKAVTSSRFTNGATALHLACQGGNLEVVKMLIKQGLDVNAKDDNGSTMLHYTVASDTLEYLITEHGLDVNAVNHSRFAVLHFACMYGNDETVEMLFKHGADSTVESWDGKTAIHLACGSGKLGIVKMLLTRGLDVHATDENGHTALHYSMNTGTLEVPEFLVTEHGLDVNATNEHGWSVLHTACALNHSEVVEMLLMHGVNTNATNENGVTALLVACTRGNLEVVKSLLEYGADVNVTDINGCMALHYVMESDSQELLEYLVTEHALDVNAANKNGYTVLHVACKENNMSFMKFLFDRGVNAHATDSSGATAFHVACLCGSLPMVKFLLERGFDVNTTNNDGATALNCAIENDSADVPEYLMKMALDSNGEDKFEGKSTIAVNIDASATDKRGWSSLHGAAFGGNVNLVEKLLAIGVDPNTSDKSGWSVLHAAALAGQIEVVNILLEHGADASATNQDGQSVLFAATSGDNIDLMKTLLKCGVDVYVADKNGMNVLHVAAKWSSKSMFNFCMELGLDTNATANNGDSVLHFAAQSQNLEIIQLLVEQGFDVNLRNKEGKTPLTACLQWESDVYDFLTVLKAVYALMSVGAKYYPLPEDYPVVVGEKSDQAAIIPICVKHWTEEQRQGKKTLTQIPPEVFARGPKAVKTYLNEIDASSDLDLVLRRKVCVIGSGKTGKSSLIRSITTMTPTLVDVEDRTIGVDLFSLDFTEVGQQGEPAKNHQITFWDFAGQDEYQVAHTLFFSRRTLYLLCVDTEAFAQVVDESRECDDEDEAEAMIDGFVKDRVWRWFRLVFMRQPDAEFVVVATKVDAFHENPSRVKELEDTLMSILGEYKSLFGEQVKQEVEALQAKKESTVDGRKASARIEHLERMRTRLTNSLPTSWLPVDVTKANSIQDARSLIEQVVTQSDRSFLMPDKYSRVLEKIQELREEPPHQTTKARIKQIIMPLPELRKQLVQGVENLEPEDCETILETLHDLGDVLWYDRDGLGVLGDTVILSARLLIDLVRQIICHDPIKNVKKTRTSARVSKLVENMLSSGQVPHELVTTFTLWKSLEYPNQMLRFKRLLQHFQLAYPAHTTSMEADSDLIVPTFWKLREDQLDTLDLEPLGDKFRSSLAQDAAAASTVRVFHWEYDFHFEMVDTMFEQLAVQSYSVFPKRTAYRSCVESIPNPHYAIRLSLVKEDGRQIISLEVAAVDVVVAGEYLQKLYESLELVLKDYPGITVTKYGVDSDGARERIDQVIDTVRSASAARRAVLQSEYEWLPSDSSWYKLPGEVTAPSATSNVVCPAEKTTEGLRRAGALQSWQNVLSKVSSQLSTRDHKIAPVVSKRLLSTLEQSRSQRKLATALPAQLQTLPSDSFRRELQELVRGELSSVREELKTKMDTVGNKLLQTSAGDGNHRDLPALWMVEYVQKPKARLILWIMSEISGRCFHKPIDIAVSPQFLAKHGDKLQLGLSVFSSVLPDAPVVSMIKTAFELGSPALDSQLAHASSVHDLLGNLGLENGGALNTSKQRPVSPAGMYGLLRALLKIHDPDFEPDKICDLAKLECGMVLQEGGYRWAHRSELLREPELYKLRVEYAGDSVLSRSSTTNQLAPSGVKPMYYMSDFRASGLSNDDARLAYCKWELVNSARSVRIGCGETIQNPYDGPVQSWWQEAFVLSGVESIEDFFECELVVEVKRPSKLVLRSDRPVGRGSIKLRNIVTIDGNQGVNTSRIVVPLTKIGGSKPFGTVECRLWELV